MIFPTILALVALTDLTSGNLITVSKERSFSRCCMGSSILNCHQADIDTELLGSPIILPDETPLTFQNNIAFNPHHYYYENGQANAIFTYNPATGGMHGHALTSQGESYVLEFCGTEGHVWKLIDQQTGKREAAHGYEDAVQMPENLDLPIRANHSALLEQGAADQKTVVWYSIKFYYTPQFAAVTADIDGFLEQAVAETNQGYANSGINLIAYKLCMEQATINDNYYGSTMLDQFSYMKADLRDGADTAALIIGDFSLCGIAWLNTISTGATYSVTKKQCAVGLYVLGHEIGHNIGAHHDPATNQNPYYAYGHGHLIQGGNGYSGSRTIMSYYAAGHEVTMNVWSNPNKYLAATNTVTGIVGLSNNARLLNENRFSLEAVGDERSPTCQHPSWTTTSSTTRRTTTTKKTTTTTTEKITTTTKKTTTTTKKTTTTTKKPTTQGPTTPNTCMYPNKFAKPGLLSKKKKIRNAKACQALCLKKKGCFYWNWIKKNKLCKLMGIKFSAKTGNTSGVVTCTSC